MCQRRKKKSPSSKRQHYYSTSTRVPHGQRKDHVASSSFAGRQSLDVVERPLFLGRPKALPFIRLSRGSDTERVGVGRGRPPPDSIQEIVRRRKKPTATATTPLEAACLPVASTAQQLVTATAKPVSRSLLSRRTLFCFSVGELVLHLEPLRGIERRTRFPNAPLPASSAPASVSYEFLWRRCSRSHFARNQRVS